MDSAEIERTRIIKYIKLQLTVMEQKKKGSKLTSYSQGFRKSLAIEKNNPFVGTIFHMKFGVRKNDAQPPQYDCLNPFKPGILFNAYQLYESNQGLLGGIFLFKLRCLPMSILKDVSLIWVNIDRPRWFRRLSFLRRWFCCC